MARVHYIGTGEAFDHRLPNTSILYEGGLRVLLDCGYSIPHALWGHSTDPDLLDGVYLTHFHADHCFGLPALIARMGEDGRERTLKLMGGPGSKASIRLVLETGYPGMLAKAPFELEFLEIDPREPREVGPLTLQTAPSWHKLPNHSVRIDEGTSSVCYSGDGGPSPQTEALYQGATLLIHEAYHPGMQPGRSHASVPGCVALAARANVAHLHVLHLKRGSPRPIGVHVPVPGEVFEVPG